MSERYPMTPGLLASMAMQMDLSFAIRTTERQRRWRGLGRAVAVYLYGGNPKAEEEITGEGFYHPDREAEYAALIPPSQEKEDEDC